MLPARVRGRLLAVATLAFRELPRVCCIQVNFGAAFAAAGKGSREHEGTIRASAAC